MRPDLRTRLRRLRVDIDDDTADRHLSAVQAALAEPLSTVTVRRKRRWRMIVVVAALLALPLAAFAAERTVPGDTLYPLKRSFERVWLLVDPGVEGRNRVTELERVIAQRRSLSEVLDRLADAAVAVERHRNGRALMDRLDAARQRIRADYRTVIPTPEEARTGDAPDTEAPPVPSETTTTVAPITRPPPDEEQTTTTTTPSDDGGDDSTRRG